MTEDRYLTADEVAALLALNRATVWRNVVLGVLPKPYYPVPRAARWKLSDIEAAVAARQMLPREAVAARRAARTAAATATTK
jgi:predicted DNA-binding transcriptional regulator AlpA